MKVHIVLRVSEHDRILPRKARLLVERLGWSMSGVVDPDADVNYAFPYMEIHNRCDTPFAAYFTHREDDTPGKLRRWESQAKRASLRITSAQQYATDLERYGPTARILPPLDRDFFSPARGPARARPRAGVSGFVYDGGRKGEVILRAAMNAPGGRAFDWDAIGRGWPIATRRIKTTDLADWYNTLDLYVCPSLIEGIPYGPLEALACGVPVVIPVGVGLLDELPDIPGIIRYERGSWQGLADALRGAPDILPGVDRDALRAATAPFTAEGWVEGHLAAFSGLSAPGAAPIPAGTAKTGRGVYVVAYGAPARTCAIRLIASIRTFMPAVPVAVVSDTPLPGADINVTYPDADLGGRTAKTLMFDLSPWGDTLYLDADTELTADVSFLFDALDAGWEMVCTKDQDAYDTMKTLWRRDSQELRVGLAALGSDRALQLAGGVVAFRRTPATAAFFEAWHREWKVLARRDQGAMARAFYANPVRLLLLGNEWNSFTGIFTGDTAGITHHRGGPARRQKAWKPGRLDDPRRQRIVRERPAIGGKGMWFVHKVSGARMNASPGSRVFQRFTDSPMWEVEPEVAARPDNADPGTQKNGHTTDGRQLPPAETTGEHPVKHVGGGMFELPDGRRVKGRTNAEALLRTTKAAS